MAVLDSPAIGIGIVGCGYVAPVYCSMATKFRGLKVVACADMEPVAARILANDFALRAQKLEELLANEEVNVVVNLTAPAAHYQVSRMALEAGKHVYSEKPLALSMIEAHNIHRMATEKNLLVGCAPDTFLGSTPQLARKHLDADVVGPIIGGCCNCLSLGMEHWHPRPDAFYQPGGGPVMDMGPYYIAGLVNLIGPIRRVVAMTSTARSERISSSPSNNGRKINVQTPTTLLAVLEFRTGALVSMAMSWDVWAHRQPGFELYGLAGSMYIPNPNYFGGEVLVTNRNDQARALPVWNHPYIVASVSADGQKQSNWRTAGLADMVAALRNGRSPRCSLALAMHVLEVATAIVDGGKTCAQTEMNTTCERPDPLTPAEAICLLVSPAEAD